MTMFFHFNELKFRTFYYIFGIFINFFVTYAHAPQIIKLITVPFFDFTKKKDFDFIFTTILEVFNTYISLSIYNSFFFSLPILYYFSYSFLKSGLYKFEKHILFKLLIFEKICIFISLIITYLIIYPNVLSFLLTLDMITEKNFIVLKMETKLFEYIEFTSKCFIFYYFFIFQLPLFMSIYIYNKKIKPNNLYKKRRSIILIFSIFSCIFSTPDIQSLLIILFLFLFLFEFIVFITILRFKYKKLFLKKRVA